MDFDDDLTPEEMILEDIKEWITYNILETQTWDEYMETLSQKEYSKKIAEFMEIYWRDHIFPIDKY
jgi:hypothetical protein